MTPRYGYAVCCGMGTRCAAVWVRGVLRYAKVQHRTRTRGTRFDQDWELPLSIQMQWSRKRKKLTNPTYLGSFKTNCSGLSSDLSCVQPLNYFECGRSTLNKSNQVIINTPGCPAFPDTEWLNLTQGKSINLDNIFSGFYSTFTNNQSIGEVEFKFGMMDISKPVMMHGDWTIMFDLTRDAFLFTFTHRAEELKVYQCYILHQFTTKHESEHPRVITLDRAIRNWVSECQDSLLSNLDQFNNLQTMHLDHYGVAKSGHTAGCNFANLSNKPSTRKQNEPCWNWNKGISRCRKNCYYLHICKLCLKKGHTSNKCPQGKSTASSSRQQGETAKLGSSSNVDWPWPWSQSCCAVEWECFTPAFGPSKGILKCRGYQYYFQQP